MAELKIIKERENNLFKRKEIQLIINSDKSPSRGEVSGLLAEKFSVPVENIKIKKILSGFGSKVFNVEANIYSSKEEKDFIEIKKKKESVKAPLPT